MAETWILYQTTNVCNDKIYVGVHKLQNTSRSRKYLGSGNRLKTAVKKYGRENFIRETLAEFACAKDAYAAEAEIVTEEFIKRFDTYNLTMGGVGTVGVKGNLKVRNTKLRLRLPIADLKLRQNFEQQMEGQIIPCMASIIRRLLKPNSVLLVKGKNILCV